MFWEGHKLKIWWINSQIIPITVTMRKHGVFFIILLYSLTQKKVPITIKSASWENQAEGERSISEIPMTNEQSIAVYYSTLDGQDVLLCEDAFEQQ